MAIKEMYERLVAERSCFVCSKSSDGGLHCAYGPYCGKRGKYWAKMPYEGFLAHELRRKKQVLEREKRRIKDNQTAKADAGKLELDLVPTQILRDVAEVRMYGNAKYGDPDNWKLVEMRRYVNALLRHTLEFLEDHNSVDAESGIEHYKHMACNMAFICHMMQERKDTVPWTARIVGEDVEPRVNITPVDCNCDNCDYEKTPYCEVCVTCVTTGKFDTPSHWKRKEEKHDS